MKPAKALSFQGLTSVESQWSTAIDETNLSVFIEAEVSQCVRAHQV